MLEFRGNNMKYIYTAISVVMILFTTHIWAYKSGYKKGYTEAHIEYQGDLNAQAHAIQEANKKILDFQRLISNNNDECFNRLWPSEIIESVNPQLR